MNEAVWMGLHADLGCSRPIHSKASLRRHPLNHKHPYPDRRAAHRGFMQQLYQREDDIKPALHCLLLPVSHVLCGQHLITNAPQPGMDTGCSAHASEQPCSAQILIPALIWSRTGDIPLSGNGHRPALWPSPFPDQF